VIAALAVWLRKRFGMPGGAAAQSEAAEIAIGETVPLPDSGQDLSREAVAPAAEPTEAAVRCRIVDGYLVLAPEGGEAALSRLGSGGARKAKVEGSISLTPVEEDEAAVDALAADEPSVVEGPVAEEEAGAEAVPAEELISAEALAAGEGMVDEPTLEDTEDLAARARELVESLGDEDEDARRQAAEGLWGLAESGHAELLVPYLNSDDARVRLTIAGVLGESQAAEFAGPLAELAVDPDPSVRATVLYAFSQLGQAAGEHLDAVRKGLSDEEGSVRARAVEALAAMAPDDDEVAAQVVALTGDPEFPVREAATSAALNFARNGVTEPLVTLLADLGRRAQALELLQQAEADVIKQLLAAAAKATSESSAAAMGTLSYVVGTRCTPADFSADLQSSDSEVRLAGLEGLAIVGAEESRADVARMSEGDSSPEVRQRAAEILTYWDEMAESTARAGADPAGSSA
jgi:HEAT repeat protein